MKRVAFYVITVMGGLWLEIVLSHVLGGSWLSIQPLAIAVMYWGLSRGPVAGPVIGFLWGLMLDAASLGLLGERALLFSSAGFVAGVFRRQLDETKPWTQAVFTFLVSIGIVLGEQLIEHVALDAARPVAPITWLRPFWNAAVAPLVFLCMQSWDLIWDVRRVES